MPIPYLSDENFPRVSAELLEAIEARFPDRCPGDFDNAERDVFLTQGALRVIRMLRRIHNQQNKDQE